MTLSMQFYSFFLTIGIGFVIGVIFDLYRVVLGLLHPKKVAMNLSDFFFWVIITFVVFVLLIFGNWGEVRLYVFIGLLLGVVLYLKLLSKYIIFSIVGSINFIHQVILGLKKVINFIIMCISYPCRLLYRLLLIPFRFLKLFNLKTKKSLQSTGRSTKRLASKFRQWFRGRWKRKE